MGWDISLINPDGGHPVVALHHAGSIITVGGSTSAWMNLTYNYSPFYYKLFPEDMDLKWIRAKKAGDTIEVMRAVLAKLGEETSDSDWDPTSGNAGHALKTLKAWHEQHPDGLWCIT